MQRKGVGSAILANLLERGRQAGHHVVVACIDGEQQASIDLHRRFGFEMAGRLSEVGWKFNRRLDVVYMQRILDAEV
jgi:phosphinothricin acetyltransferase